MTGIIDYGAGNLLSVANAVRSLGVESKIVAAPEDFDGVTRLILPGVGSFGDCVENLKRQQLWQPIKQWLADGKPYFGICLGYQVLFESSEETPGVEGLGHFAGQVVEFSPEAGDKIPHMGWNEVSLVDPAAAMWNGLADRTHVYFVHSFFPRPADGSIVACRTDYAGESFAAAVMSGAVWATQFHPERSQAAGLQLMKNFIDAN
ncbi:imidazole glycerol phosphate synthase subunit HisH [Sulfuriroseicoccus oceanibius]|uniref:Imidazole glycerol phosphate synthase subunit HisH n=1 Tax=Sulfuriroseicoccus oceanibius TaxID=2707525 RepID=A0A6B3L4S2_9BACT|nr:imidazole glycerol phosphate synthase subunit HisH [Sulfuriroseicoccus oceanibius]QQL43994.1 imidazole glycerol phosphate synthase subunit HisH [Sulfuriroseicoccus oceanibius]